MAKSILALGLMGLASMVDAAPMRVARAVDTKRGVPYNDGELTKLFHVDGSKISWLYNWGSTTSGEQSGLNYVPMLHSNDPGHTSTWNADVEQAINSGSTHVFSFNEPDQCGGGGACMQDVGVTAAAHKEWIQPLAEKYPDLRIGAPAVTNGVQDSNTGALMGIPYLKAFLEACDGCKIDFVVAHWYDAAENVEYFKNHLEEIHTASGGKNVWLTEFGASGDAEAFLKTVMPWMDEQPWLMRYSYQWAAPGSLINEAGDGLSSLGQVFATA